MVSTAHCSPKTASLKIAPTMQTVGRTFHGQGRNEDLQLLGSSLQVNQWSYHLDDFLNNSDKRVDMVLILSARYTALSCELNT